MALDNSKYIIYRTPYKDNYLTIFRFKTQYEGLSSFIKLLDIPVFILSIIIFSLQFRSISLFKKLLRNDFEEIKEISIPDHELEILKNFDEYKTKDLLYYLYIKSRRVKNFIKTANLNHTRWFSKYKEHLFNLKLLEKFAEDSKYVSFIGCIPFPCLLNFKKESKNIFTYISFLVSALPIFLADLIRFILFALATNNSIVFSDKGVRNLRIQKLTKTKEIKERKQIIVSIYFFREIEHFYEIVKSLPDQFEYIIVSLNRVSGIEEFFLKKGFNLSSEYLRVKKINYFEKFIKTFINILIHPIYIFNKRKILNGTIFYAFIYNFFSLTTLIRIICLKEIIDKNFQNYKFLSFNTWELPFVFYYDEKPVKTFGRYCLVPGVYTSQYFRPHDYILSINKSQFSKFKYLHKKEVLLLGKNIEKSSKINDNLNVNFEIKSKKYMIWIGTVRGPGMSNEMLFNSLKKTKVLSDYFGLKLMIRAHPTISREDTLKIYGEILEEDFIFDNNSPLEEVARMPAIFSLTNSTADLTILKYLNPCVFLGLEKLIDNKVVLPYKKVLGKLCNQNENSVLDYLKYLENNEKSFNAYKNNINKFLDSIIYPNANFDKELSKIFNN